jgi:hypothetical protein
MAFFSVVSARRAASNDGDATHNQVKKWHRQLRIAKTVFIYLRNKLDIL